MIKRIANILGIDIIPRWLLIRLFILATSLGAFIAIIFITAVSSFVFDEKIANFPEAMAISGFFGIIVYNLYKYLQQNFRYNNVIRIFFIFIIVCVLLAVYLPKLSSNFSTSFLLFVIWLPLTILAEQLIIGIGDKIIIERHQQNLKRFIEAGIIAGSIFYSVVAGFLMNYGIMVPLVIPSLVLLIIVVIESDYLIKRLELKDKQDEEKIESVISLLSDLPQKFKMLSLLFFVFLSVINFVFIDYSFLKVLSLRYLDLKSQVLFLSFFFATIMAANLVFKLFVYQNLVKTFRVKSALFIPSVFLLTVLLILTLLIFVPAHSNFNQPTILVFMLVIIGRFFAFLLRESLELNVFKLILSAFSTYSEKLISSNMFNLLSLWGYLLSGLLLLLLASFDFSRFYAVLFSNQFFALCWVFFSFLLIYNYSGLINKNIEKLSELQVNTETSLISMKDRLLISSNLSGMKYLLNHQHHNLSIDTQKPVAKSNDNIQRRLGIEKTELIGTNLGKTYADKIPAGEDLGIAFYDSDENQKLVDIELLVSSHRTKDRIKAVKKISESGDLKYRELFKMLINDNDSEVKRNAIVEAVNYHNGEIIAEIIDYINHEEFSSIVMDVLTKLGDEIIEPLNAEFDKTAVEFQLQLQIIKIIGEINTIDARNFLLNKLVYPNKWVVIEASNALLKLNCIENLYHNALLKQAIKNTIWVAAWIITKELSLDKVSQKDPVKIALQDEYSRTVNLLFNLLQLKYNSNVFGHIKKDFVYTSSNEQNEFDIELLNQIVDDSEKSQLFPLLHNNQRAVKIEQLQKLFPLQVKSQLEALNDIMISDSGFSDMWLKACALKLYLEQSENSDAVEVYAQIFNPNHLLAEIAFFGIYQKYPDKVEDIMGRVSKALKNRIFNIIEFNHLYEHKLLYNKVIALQRISYFNKLPGHLLIPFAELLEEYKLEVTESKFLKCSEEEVLPVFFIPYGEVSMTDQHKRVTRLNNNTLYGLGLYIGGVTLNAYSPSVIYYAKPEHIGYLVINYDKLSDAIFKYIQNSNFY